MVVKYATKTLGSPRILWSQDSVLCRCVVEEPWGVILGYLCIIDFQLHPEGLTNAEKERLHTFASEAVYVMITRLLNTAKIL